MCSKEDMERCKNGESRLIQFVSIEATANAFKDEPVLTIYLRDMTEYVRAIKSELKHDKKRMKGEYVNKIVDTCADLVRNGQSVP